MSTTHRKRALILFEVAAIRSRWQHGSTLAAIYLADEESTAWAEWHRVLAESALPPAHGMPRDLCE
ncbi:MAG TPA: hypothetical protein VID48_03260 [Solirubrobacteraceae bacterium]|jgi:hypothetical protein